jgi:hypothetical protein
MKDGKTKKCDGVQLSSNRFAYVGDESDTSTWHFVVHVLGNEQKTINGIKNALYRFDQTNAIPQERRAEVWHTLRGAALSHGIKVEPREFPAPVVPAQITEQPPATPVIEEPEIYIPTEKELRERYRLEAMADHAASAFLKSWGME